LYGSACTLLWPVVIYKTIVQQNRIESLNHNVNPLKQKGRCTNIPGRLHQKPAAQLAQELNSIHVDWTNGTNSPCDESPAYLTMLLDAANSAAAPASRVEASRYESAVVQLQDTVTSHMRDLPARHGIGVNPSGRFLSERLRPDGSLETGTPAEARYLAMTSLRWWCPTVLPGAR